MGLVEVLIAFVVYSALIGINPLHIVGHFGDILFFPSYIDHSIRSSLLLFWMLNLAASLLFVLIVAQMGSGSSIHRKFFHLTLSLVFVSGVLVDGPLLSLSAALLLSIFIIIELFRYYEVPPWGETLNKHLEVFRDGQDGALLLTPIFLLTGVCVPLLLSPSLPLPSPSFHPPLQLFAGVVSVGVGDSVAALVGTFFGKNRWPRRRKTVEGSLGMLLSQVVVLLFLRSLLSTPSLSFLSILFVSLILTALEAFLINVDNIVLPIVGYGLIWCLS